MTRSALKSTAVFFLGGVVALSLAATAFRGGGMPVDSTFTYQGQLRNAGQLVNGNVDVRFTLWDSDVGGTQIGVANSFPNYPLTDGRFALGLNFGTGAFNGDQRWVQVEFRSPAGVGQYLTLSPRDKIQATPYALYALNGVESQWDYNPKTQALSTGENVAKVGIGTTTPTALLEVVGASGDDAVRLPAGSIGLAELSAPLVTRSGSFTGAVGNACSGGTYIATEQTIVVPANGFLTVSGVGKDSCAGYNLKVMLDGQQLPITAGSTSPGTMWAFNGTVPVSAGPHVLKITIDFPWNNCLCGFGCTGSYLFTPESF